jgi:hypothetical protein
MSGSRSCSSSVKKSRSTPLLQQKGACSWSALLFGGLLNALTIYALQQHLYLFNFAFFTLINHVKLQEFIFLCLLSLPAGYVFSQGHQFGLTERIHEMSSTGRPRLMLAPVTQHLIALVNAEATVALDLPQLVIRHTQNHAEHSPLICNAFSYVHEQFV